MNSLPATVGDFYQYVVGVDTHAATHSYAIIEAPNGGLIDQNAFPTSPAGLRRARERSPRRTEGHLDGGLIGVRATASDGAVVSGVLQHGGDRVVEAPTPRRARARSKTDALDALLAPRSSLVMPLTTLRGRRAGELQAALRVLTGARDQQNADRRRCISGLSALVWTHDLGITARRALTGTQIATIAS